MDIFTNKAVIKLIAGVVLGSLLGYAYYHFFGCQGTCPLSSNWLTTTLFGAFFGFVLLFPDKKKQKNDEGK